MFKISTAPEALKESGGGSKFINTSGVYDVVIKFASMTTSKNGSQSLTFNVDYNGNSQTFYGPNYTNNDGGVNKIGAALYNRLGVIAGMSDGDEFTQVEETHPVGANQEDHDFTVIEEFSELPVKMHVQFEYGKYNGDIQERKNIRAFFRDADGATADEITNGAEAGTQLAIVLEKYADNITYKDGVTAEDVTDWIEAKKSGGKTATPKAKSAGKPARRNPFG